MYLFIYLDRTIVCLKFRCYEKATKVCPIFHLSFDSAKNWKMGETFVAFSEYMNFTKKKSYT